VQNSKKRKEYKATKCWLASFPEPLLRSQLFVVGAPFKAGRKMATRVLGWSGIRLKGVLRKIILNQGYQAEH